MKSVPDLQEQGNGEVFFLLLEMLWNDVDQAVTKVPLFADQGGHGT